ncbi:uncharacterized protein [Rutidosis leptorrhynchoides]|uniref:uncharacterized protein n=1 Tax=Rutidosis leptorrhynchoides TaxID=125765 RepID=UPI003A9942B0
MSSPSSLEDEYELMVFDLLDCIDASKYDELHSTATSYTRGALIVCIGHGQNAPLAWGGQFTPGDHGYPTIMLEVVASYDNWIWHAYFGVTGLNNDIYVLDTSDLFKSMLNEEMSGVPYIVNGVEYKRGYYLADKIYSMWSAFVKPYSSVIDPKRAYFSKKQAGARKDVERIL